MITANNILELVSEDGGSFRCNSLDDAYSFCLKLARSHYENFPVASFFLPKEKIPYIASVYAFSRIADDIADELVELTIEERHKLLEKYRLLLENCDTENYTNPIFYALSNTIKSNNLPKLPFHKLLTAFQMDLNFKQAENFEDLLYYCEHSANPVGELVLRIFNNYTEKTAPLSDNICTGLQLINFWQDLSIDLQKGRNYIPKKLLIKYEMDRKILQNEKNSLKLYNTFEELFHFTESIFTKGKELIYLISDKGLKFEIKFTYNAGYSILQKLKRMNVKLLETRPKLNKLKFSWLALKSIF